MIVIGSSTPHSPPATAFLPPDSLRRSLLDASCRWLLLGGVVIDLHSPSVLQSPANTTSRDKPLNATEYSNSEQTSRAVLVSVLQILSRRLHHLTRCILETRYRKLTKLFQYPQGMKGHLTMYKQNNSLFKLNTKKLNKCEIYKARGGGTPLLV